MYCKNCGSQIDDKAVVCPNCGVATDNFNAAPTLKQTNVLAVVGFILSFIIAVAGLVCSIIGYRRATKYNGNGKALAIAGITISSVELAAAAFYVVFYMSIFLIYFLDNFKNAL